MGSRSDGGPATADVGFLQDMIDHHDQAVRMAVIELSNGSSDIPKSFAADVIAGQRYEMGLMEGWLLDWGSERGAPTREVMGWMGEPLPLASMPGLATQRQLDALAKSHGADADARYFQLMITHHEGGVHMAEHAAEHATDAKVRKLAARMARFQSLEIGDMQKAQDQLNLPR